MSCAEWFEATFSSTTRPNRRHTLLPIREQSEYHASNIMYVWSIERSLARISDTNGSRILVLVLIVLSVRYRTYSSSSTQKLQQGGNGPPTVPRGPPAFEVCGFTQMTRTQDTSRHLHVRQIDSHRCPTFNPPCERPIDSALPRKS